jgi:hypothetical protein
MIISTRYADRYQNFNPKDRCYEEVYNISKDYETESIKSDLDLDFNLNGLLGNSIEEIFKFGIDSLKADDLDGMKDAAATLFTASRFFACDESVSAFVESSCKHHCKDLIKKIFVKESGFNFLKFYDDAGYDFYTTDQTVQETKLTYSLIMGV